ncbi:MAG: SRPBCC family protein, partial [Leptolyngbyaceae bacterium]|nr:SRPBCC family protein [Leptolyngbyaceae bacterium]
GGAVTAEMYVPKARTHVWQQVTEYSQWVHFFPDMVKSEVLSKSDGLAKSTKRLYQVARKAFFLLSVQVEIYLKAIESTQHTASNRIRFVMEKGTFQDFEAELQLQDFEQGTLLTYTVQATPNIPVPSALIQEAMKLDLPSNMKQMRTVICRA